MQLTQPGPVYFSAAGAFTTSTGTSACRMMLCVTLPRKSLPTGLRRRAPMTSSSVSESGHHVQHGFGHVLAGGHLQGPLEVLEADLGEHLGDLVPDTGLVRLDHIEIDTLGHVDDGQRGLSQVGLLGGLLQGQVPDRGCLVGDDDAHLNSLLSVGCCQPSDGRLRGPTLVVNVWTN